MDVNITRHKLQAKPGLQPKLNGSQDISGETSVSQYEIDKAN